MSRVCQNNDHALKALISWKRKKAWDFLIKDTHMASASSNKTQALTRSMYMDIWVAGTLNQLHIRGS